MKLKPIGDRIIVRAMEADEKTKGGIILPDVAKEKPQIGEVIAVGPGKKSEKGVVALDVKKGDKVLYGKYSGTEVSVEGEDLSNLSRCIDDVVKDTDAAMAVVAEDIRGVRS